MTRYRLRDRDKLLIEKIIRDNSRIISEYINKGNAQRRHVFNENVCEEITKRYESILTKYFECTNRSHHLNSKNEKYWKKDHDQKKHMSTRLHNAFSLLVLVMSLYDAINDNHTPFIPELFKTGGAPKADPDMQSAFVTRLIYALAANWNHLVIEKAAKILNENPTITQKIRLVAERLEDAASRLKRERRCDEFVNIINKEFRYVMASMLEIDSKISSSGKSNLSSHQIVFKYIKKILKSNHSDADFGLVIDRVI